MSDETRIYSTSNGAVVLKGRAKNEIIKLLMKGDKTFSELQEETGKAKSTLSVHLSDLEGLGVVKEHTDPEDHRKKIFSLRSRLVGSSDTPSDEQYRMILENLGSARGDKYLFLKNLFHLIRHGLYSMGLDLHPALKDMGRDAGRVLAGQFTSEDLEGLLGEVSQFWKENGLGEVSVLDQETIQVRECFDCGGMPNTSQSLCSLDEGILEGIIEARLGVEVRVVENECSGTGSDRCTFVIKETGK